MPFILKWETVYKAGYYGKDEYVITERDSDDPGGATKYGIDQRSHPDVKIDSLTREQAIAIYFKDYWQRFKCGAKPSPLAEVYFNCCVNCGAGRAEKILALSGNNAAKFLAEHEAFYHRLAAQKPIFKKYLKGWLNRTQDLRKFLGL